MTLRPSQGPYPYMTTFPKNHEYKSPWGKSRIHRYRKRYWPEVEDLCESIGYCFTGHQQEDRKNNKEESEETSKEKEMDK